jgi:hypothetical protein
MVSKEDTMGFLAFGSRFVKKINKMSRFPLRDFIFCW